MSFIDPYFGVSGFMTKAEVSAVLEKFERLSNWRRSKLMVGVLASSKTLAGGTNKYPNRYPKVGEIAGLFPSEGRTLNLIHYATDDRDTLGDQLEELIRLGGTCLHGFQLNIRWPDPASIAFLKGKRVVLQLRNDAFGEVGRLLDYKDVITDVLVDASAGRGVPLDIGTTEAYVSAISRVLPEVGIGVAGGLCAKTIFSLNDLVHEWPMLSIDAEGRLRTPEDHLDIQAVKDYLEAADDLFD